VALYSAGARIKLYRGPHTCSNIGCFIFCTTAVPGARLRPEFADRFEDVSKGVHDVCIGSDGIGKGVDRIVTWPEECHDRRPREEEKGEKQLVEGRFIDATGWCCRVESDLWVLVANLNVRTDYFLDRSSSWRNVLVLKRKFDEKAAFEALVSVGLRK
jgi:hypothetical protein